MVTESPLDDWLGRLNGYRADSGLAAVSENPTWTAGIAAHVHYLENTPQSYFTGPYASAHPQNQAAPLYTPEGAPAALVTNVTYGEPHAQAAIVKS